MTVLTQKHTRVKLLSDACRVDLLSSGPPYFEQLQQLINGAQHELHLQMYIFDDDTTGQIILKSLKEAAHRGVQVYMFIDAYGVNLSKPTIAAIKDSGIHLKFFSFFLYKKQFQPGRRLHHKIVIADGCKALVGGMNIADKYSGYGKERPWLDYAVLLEGNVCYELRKIAIALWKKKKLTEQDIIPQPAFNAEKTIIPVAIKINDWLRTKQQISKSYRRAIRYADSSVIIMAGYFLPGSRIRYLLKMAAARGVDIRIIVPQKSDVKMVKRATNHLYGWLLKNNMAIFEYNKGMVHAKVMVVDSNWVTIGSYNLNNLSDYASIELNVDIAYKEFAGKVKSEMEQVIQTACDSITTDNYMRKRSLLNKMADRISYFLLRLSMRLLTLFKGAAD